MSLEMGKYWDKLAMGKRQSGTPTCTYSLHYLQCDTPTCTYSLVLLHVPTCTYSVILLHVDTPTC